MERERRNLTENINDYFKKVWIEVAVGYGQNEGGGLFVFLFLWQERDIEALDEISVLIKFLFQFGIVLCHHIHLHRQSPNIKY